MGDVTRFRRLKWAAPPVIGTGQWAKPAKSRVDWLGSLGLTAFAFVLSAIGFAWMFGGLDDVASGASQRSAATPVTTSFDICRSGAQTNCVVDGDTFRYRGANIRIADIDTPETRDAQCDYEHALGETAKHRLRGLLNAASFTIEPYELDHDQYGRDLRIITRDGRSIGMILVAEGLARPWDGSRHPWC